MIDRKLLETVYNSGKSLTETAKKINCSPNKVVYWMKKYNIKRRGHSESAYIKQNPNGDPFVLKDVEKLNRGELILYGLGLGIYWGEGNKASGCRSLRVTNSDPGLIRIFLKFMKEIFSLDDKRFSFSIVSFNDIKPEVARSYWSKELGISPERFGKITVVPSQGRGTYKKKSKFGICTAQGNNTKLRDLVMNEIEKLRLSRPK